MRRTQRQLVKLLEAGDLQAIDVLPDDDNSRRAAGLQKHTSRPVRIVPYEQH
jgi:hypothetical protein